MTRKPRKPYDPSIKAAREAEAARLKQQGAEVNRDKRTGEILGARRPNVFDAFLAQKPHPIITQGQHNAATKLMADWAEWKGLDGRGEAAVGKVDGGTAARELVTDRMLRAGRRVAMALHQIGPMDRGLLLELVKEAVANDRPKSWREVVREQTGVETKDKQSSMIVAALENLRRVYEGPRPQHLAAA